VLWLGLLLIPRPNAICGLCSLLSFLLLDICADGRRASADDAM